MADAPLSTLGEKTIVSKIVLPRFASDEPPIEVGLGDDAAVVAFPKGSSLVATIDKLPEQLIPHALGLMSWSDVGYYLLVSSLSDIAAMGAAPLGALISVCLPADFNVAHLDDLLDGVRRASDQYRCPVIGGDTKGATASALVSTVIGHVPSGEALRRDAARAGHVVCVTGNAGRVATALAYYTSQRHEDFLPDADRAYLVDGFRNPVPRLRAAEALRESRACGACQDVSDGLGQTAIEISSSSGVAIVIDEERLLNAGPQCAAGVATRLQMNHAGLLLGPGADYELMFTVSESNSARVCQMVEAQGVSVAMIGRVISGEGVWLEGRTTRERVQSPGFEHLTGQSDLAVVLQRQRP